jgi:hypothetical protein
MICRRFEATRLAVGSVAVRASGRIPRTSGRAEEKEEALQFPAGQSDLK